MSALSKPLTPTSRSVQILGILAWLVLAAGILLFWTAKPESETFLDRRWEKTVRTAWDTDQARLGLTFLRANIALCLLGFLLNLLEKAAHGVHLNRSLILAGVASALLVFWLPRLI